MAYFEDFLIGNKKSRLSKLNSKHIFLSGMPRSATTIITHILSNFDDVGTYNYSDLPFFKIPFFWSKVKKFYYLNNKNISFAKRSGVLSDSEDFFKFRSQRKDDELREIGRLIFNEINKKFKVKVLNIFYYMFHIIFFDK